MSTRNKPWRRNYKRELAAVTQPGSLHTVVSRTATSPEVVKQIMVLFGVEFVPQKKYEKAVNMVRAIWRNGWEVGTAMEKRKPAMLKKINAIIRGDASASNDQAET